MQTTCDVINLCCTRDDLATMKPFIVTQYVQVESLRSKAHPSAYVGRASWEWVSVKHECIPPGRVAVRRGAKVQAVDGRVGRVEEFLMDSTSGRITHLVMREGHSWAPKDVSIPVSEIGCIGERAVYLMLDRHSVESLPAVPVKWP
jgi:sporulation protein YlmC with PRC-barrel domain